MPVAIYAAIRIEELPDPQIPSERGTCESCHAPVWIDPGGIAAVERMEGSEPLVMCLPCAARVAPDAQLAMTPEQRERLRKLGVGL